MHAGGGGMRHKISTNSGLVFKSYDAEYIIAFPWDEPTIDKLLLTLEFTNNCKHINIICCSIYDTMLQSI